MSASSYLAHSVSRLQTTRLLMISIVCYVLLAAPAVAEPAAVEPVLAESKTHEHVDHKHADLHYPEQEQSPLISVVEAWSPPAPAVVPVRAGYLQLTNLSIKTQILQAVSSAAFQNVSIHQTVAHDGVMSMEMLSELHIPPGTTHQFAPGGLHLMMMHPKRALTPGDSFSVTLSFATGPDLSFTMTVLTEESPTQAALSTVNVSGHHAH